MSLKQNNVRGGRGRKSEVSIAVAEVRLRIAHVCRGPNVSVRQCAIPITFDGRRSSGCIEWNGLDGSSGKVGWLQRCLITGLVLYLVRLGEIHQRLRYTPTLPTRYRLRGATGVLPKSRAIRDETMGALAALFGIRSHEWNDRDRHLCALRVACCRWDGRAEWHQEEPGDPMRFQYGILCCRNAPIAQASHVSG
jgi:hypothetical protein